MSSLSATAYTPLESLLLFQALRHEATTNNNDANFSFTRISEQLRNVSAVRNDPAYDSGRLSPDALRDLYLWLLKEEVKLDLQAKVDGHATPNGSASPGSKKRKISSPTLPTVLEATKHVHLIPQMLTRLYATYREKSVRETRDHERRYDALSRDVEDGHAGNTDGVLQSTGTKVQSPSTAGDVHTAFTSHKVDAIQSASRDQVVPLSSLTQTEAQVEPPLKRYSQARIDAVINHDPEPPQASSIHRRTSSNTALPPLSEMAPQSPHFGIPPKMPAPSPNVPLHLQQQPQYPHAPHSMPHSPYQPVHAHPVASPQMHNTMSRPSSSPRPILPPPPGMKLPPPSPVQMTGSPNMRGSPVQQHYYTPQHPSSLGPLPSNDRAQHAYPPQQLPPPQGYYQQPQQPAYVDRRTSYPIHQTPQPMPRYPQPPTQHGGYQLQPWPIDNGQHARQAQIQPYYQSHQATSQAQQTPSNRPPSYAQVHPAVPATAPRLSNPPHTRLLSDIVSALATPPRATRKPIWKSERRPLPINVPSEPVPPAIEPLSPVLQRTVPRSKVEQAADTVRQMALPTSKGRRTRDPSPHSVASPTAAEDIIRTRTRSHTVSTTAGVNSQSDDTSTTTRSNVKVEPSTPAETVEGSQERMDPPLSNTPATAGRIIRKRRGTLQSPAQAQPASKRDKRQHSPTNQDDAANVGPLPARSTTISAARNLGRTTGILLEEIAGHKFANYFKTAVTAKQANGYYEIVKRPQNLKSIKAAISAGGKAITAVLAASDDEETSTTVELERSTDLMPPKAIVNSAQLEKEINRMFANAVMFNPGEDGLVSDTRAMFADMEKVVGEWRAQHEDRGEEREEGEEEGGVGLEDERKGKRRKV
ncbi:hypothetical protein LTR62_004457 [Meristemomyces frigidus]|uniref:Bromo domain-containing protein n=1 Tax=Meristemomyces frigidus TaxID=1508187 RepID=A0AAN7YG25_9PEZI|nr:hypothetical protein LTR62_004457 [Meristemomyces frigidus]